MLTEQTLAWSTRHQLDDKVRAEQRAIQLYRHASGQGRLGQVWSRLTGQTSHLLKLASVEANCTVRSRVHGGLRLVAIRRIRGSQSRHKYFDRSFRPLQPHTRRRWLNLAIAWQMGVALPPIRLIQVGDIYFVLDGHHRISVARALGEAEISATVTVWQVDEPLPWEKPAGASA
jgi:hypothetical protein